MLWSRGQLEQIVNTKEVQSSFVNNLHYELHSANPKKTQLFFLNERQENRRHKSQTRGLSSLSPSTFNLNGMLKVFLQSLIANLFFFFICSWMMALYVKAQNRVCGSSDVVQQRCVGAQDSIARALYCLSLRRWSMGIHTSDNSGGPPHHQPLVLLGQIRGGSRWAVYWGGTTGSD